MPFIIGLPGQGRQLLATQTGRMELKAAHARLLSQMYGHVNGGMYLTKPLIQLAMRKKIPRIRL